MAPFPIGLVRPDSADCDRNWQVDPNCPLPNDQDNNVDNNKVTPPPLDWSDLDMDKNNVPSSSEAIKVAKQEVTKTIVNKISDEILKATRRTTKTEAAQDGSTSTPGYQVFNIGNEDQDNTEDSFSVIMTVGGVVVSVVIVGSVGNI